ncbi:MAG: choice-of-anchor D domain-containing protein [Deltaproteobacteria bacterium]|nr:choice-of-anchor D domain-containing protein [Deltaproteobacteria bacterium]
MNSSWKPIIRFFYLVALGLLVSTCGDTQKSTSNNNTICSTDKDCGPGMHCDGGFCAPDKSGCKNDLDCDPWEVCNSGKCVLRTNEPDANADMEPEQSRDADASENHGENEAHLPQIDVQPSKIEFGATRIGVMVERQVFIQNRGNADLLVQSIQIEQGQSNVFNVKWTGNLPLTVEPDKPIKLVVSYVQDDANPDFGLLLIGSNDPDPEDAIVKIPMYSQYKGSSDLVITGTPASMEDDVNEVPFGSLPVHSTGTIEIYLKNGGVGGSILTVDEVRLSPASSAFTLKADPKPPTSMLVFDSECAPGNMADAEADAETETDGEPADECATKFGATYSCVNGLCMDDSGLVPDLVKIQITFSPSSAGDFFTYLLIGNNSDTDGGQTVMLPVHGKGVIGELVAEPDPLDFGLNYTGKSYKKNITLSNKGGDDLTISEISLEHGDKGFDFKPGGPIPALLGPGDELIIEITYSPSSTGLVEDNLVIRSNAPTNPEQRIRLLGNAINPPTIMVTPKTVNFGNVEAGRRIQQELTVQNVGGDLLRISNISLRDKDTGLSFTPGSIPSLSPSESSSLYITVEASSPGIVDDELRLETNDPDSPVFTIPVTATIEKPVLTVTPWPILDFGEIYYYDGSTTSTITIENSGVGNLTVTRLDLATGSSTDFSLGTMKLDGVPVTVPVVLQPSGHVLSIDASYKPGEIGPDNGAVEIDTDIFGYEQQFLSLSGQGRDCLPGFADLDKGKPGCEYPCPVNPPVAEICDHKDNNCNGLVDEGINTDNDPENCGDCGVICKYDEAYAMCVSGNCKIGSCKDGFADVDKDDSNGCEYPCPVNPPGFEECNGVDDDCNGLVDEGVTPPADPCEVTNNFGTCTGTWVCKEQDGSTDWQCVAKTPGAEICDLKDNDCDGEIDEDFKDDRGEYLDDENCGACGVTCIGAIPHATAACVVNGDSERCEVKECDSGYYKKGPLTCIAVTSDLCSPCTQDSDCPTPGDLCLDLDSAKFCGRDCSDGNLHGTQAGECPAGFTCKDLGEDKHQCIPLSGSCTCLAENDQDQRACIQSNEYGTCYGQQTCHPDSGWSSCTALIPSVEKCDGVDNDCDNYIDDLTGRGESCPITNSIGTCYGKLDCTASSEDLVCVGQTPAIETCNYLDDDCDGSIDEDFPDLYSSCSAGTGACQRYGFMQCKPDGSGTECNAKAGLAGTEVCNNIDDDCDGEIDEDQWPQKGQPCSLGQGVCARLGVYICDPSDPSGPVICNAIPGTAGTETCNGLDDDCDGDVDEDLTIPDCPLQDGVCLGSKKTCGGLDGWLECGPSEYGADYEPVEQSCDGLDNDCDGQTDEGLSPELCALTQGVCAGSTKRCGGASGWLDCDASDYGSNYETVETTCDYLDNDCDGIIDETWQTGGVYNRDDACGNCYNDCTSIYDKPNAYGTCDTSGSSPSCTMVCCKAGDGSRPSCDGIYDYFDLNGVPDDGCEFRLDPNAIYVSANDVDADDAAGCGRGPAQTGGTNRPCLSIGTGLAEAASSGRSAVLVAGGAYYESITLVDGTSLYGGYNPVTWGRDIAANLTSIFGDSAASNKKTVTAENITSSNTVLDGFVIYGENATQPGGNSYAIWIKDSNSNLKINNNKVWAGDGAKGIDGSAGTNGSNGGNGNPGIDAYEPSAGYNCYESCTGNGAESPGGNGGTNTCTDKGAVNGGDGGLADCPDYDEDTNECSACPDNSDQTLTTTGLPGSNGGGDGGQGGCDGLMDYSCTSACSCIMPDPAVCSQGLTASTGANGANGTNGAGGTGCPDQTGSVVSGEWIGGSGTNGSDGSSGLGGGGGGAGGGVETYDSTWCSNDGGSDIGGSGGGGGAGGCRGTGGSAGAAGGGSFALFVVFSSDPLGNIPQISGNTMHRTNGGNGGDGGPGGTGGSGGHGGNGGAGGINGTSVWCAAAGAKGGEGGDGGHGGGGGGGCGGVSFGIFSSGQGATDISAWKTQNSFQSDGVSGSGGHGGGSGAGGFSGTDGIDGAEGDTNF